MASWKTPSCSICFVISQCIAVSGVRCMHHYRCVILFQSLAQYGYDNDEGDNNG